MSQRLVVRVLLALVAVVLLSTMGRSSVRAAAEPQDAPAAIARLRELLAAAESKVLLVPFPNSRSRILKADGSSDFFLYLERGNLRGTEAMNDFYVALEAGDMKAADDIFTRHSLVSLRASDYGWNGLGVPMVREDGSDNVIQDRLYQNVEGLFGPVEIGPEDSATFIEYIETILIPALGGRP